jgi:hypothetical protein
MVQNLVDYIRKQLSQGYSITQIRQSLLNYGYQAYQVDQAISQSYKTTTQQQPQPLQTQTPQKIPTKTHIPKGLIIIILLLAILGGSFFSYSTFIKPGKTPETLLDLSLEAIKTTVQPGQQISFIKKIESMGTKIRYDVTLTYQLTDSTGDIAQTPTAETVAVETKSTSKTNILIEEDVKPGDYQLKAIARYNGKKAIAAIPVKIYAKELTPTCSDNIQNQEEEGIDCGGPCKQCQSCPVCNDQDSCTEDICSENTNYQCVYQEIDDCRSPYLEEPTTISTEQIETGGYITLEDIQPQLTNLITTNPTQAAELCAQLSDRLEKDGCFSIIVNINQDSHYCQFIEGDTPRDSCYFSIMMKTNNFALCEQITSTYFKKSCDSFKKAIELSQNN